MKTKLLSVASALVLFFGFSAEHVNTNQYLGFVTGTSFSREPVFTHANFNWTTNGGFVTRFWSTADTNRISLADGSISGYWYTGHQPVYHDDYWIDEHAEINTTTDAPIVCTFAPGSSVTFSDSVYFDANISIPSFFYGDENRPTIASDAKVAVYVQDSDVGGSSHVLYVVAKDWNGKTQHFNCGTVSLNSSGRYTTRLIIQIVRNISKTGLARAGVIVYCDGVAVRNSAVTITDYQNLRGYYADLGSDGRIFAPLGYVRGGISGVSYGGSVSLGSHVVSRESPVDASVTWDRDKIQSLRIDGWERSADELKACEAIIHSPYWKTRSVEWTGTNGWSDGSYTANMGGGWTCYLDTNIVQRGRASFSGTRYVNVADALAAACAATTPGTLELLAHPLWGLSFRSPIKTDITLKLNGKTVPGGISSLSSRSGKLIIDGDWSDVTASTALNIAYSSLNLSDVTFNGSTSVSFSPDVVISSSAFNGAVYLYNNESVTISGGQFNGELQVLYTDVTQISGGDFYGTVTFSSDVTISGGWFDCTIDFGSSPGKMITGGYFNRTKNATLAETATFPEGKTLVPYYGDWVTVGDIPAE